MSKLRHYEFSITSKLRTETNFTRNLILQLVLEGLKNCNQNSTTRQASANNEVSSTVHYLDNACKRNVYI